MEMYAESIEKSKFKSFKYKKWGNFKSLFRSCRHMGTYIWFEFKRKINNPKTLFLIVLMLVLSFQRIGHYRLEGAKYSSYVSFESYGESIENLGSILFQRYGEGSEKDRDSFKLFMDTGEQVKIAAKEEDYREWTRLSAFAALIYAKSAAYGEGEQEKESFKSEAIEIWNEVSNGIDYDDVDFKYGDKTAYKTSSDFHLSEARYYHTLYKKGLDPIGRNHINSITFLYRYFDDIIPIAIGFIVLILIFDNVNEEWSNGSLKLVLTQPLSRKEYLASKLIVGILYSLFIVLIPALIVLIGFGIVNGFQNYNYPVLYLGEGFKTIEPLPNYLKRDVDEKGGNDFQGISIYSNIPGSNSGLSNRLVLIPLYKFILLSLLLLTFCIIFYVTLNLLISSTTKNKIIAFTISGLITLIGTVYSQKWIVGDKYNLSPFTMNNPVRILNGTYNATALTASIVLLGSALIIFLCNNLYYQKKDL